MNIDECYQLGYVIRKHGLDGAVNIHLDVDNPESYKNLESVFVEINQKLVPFFIEDIQIKNNKAVVYFEDVADVEAAESLKSKALYLPLSVLPPLGKGQFYYHEVMGYSMHDQQQGLVGVLKDIYESPKQDLMSVDCKGKEVLVPVTDDIITSVDHEAAIIYVNLPEGLLDIYLNP